MIWFFLSATVMVVLSLLIIAPALFNRRRIITTDIKEQNLEITRQRLAELRSAGSDNAEATMELEAALLDDLEGAGYRLEQDKPAGRLSAVALMICVPLAAGLIYFKLGDFSWYGQTDIPTPAEIAANPAGGVEALLGRLEQVLADNPNDAAGWELAARTYMTVGQYDQAERAYARLHQLSGDHPDTFTGWADASLMANGSVYSEEISARISRALEMDPNHVSALWIAAMGAQSIGSPEVALGYLERLQPLIARNAEALAQVRAAIESLGGSRADREAISAPVPVNSGAAEERTILVSVHIDGAMLEKADPGDVVFVFARATNGPPAPLAAVKLQVADLPTTVKLDRSSAMIEGMDISRFDSVQVVARVAKGGQPIAQPGDLTSDQVEIDQPGASEVSLTISSTVNGD